jgi:hypothetical protein
LFIDVDGEQWLLDTGAPTSFGASRDLKIAGEQFSLDESYLGLTAATLSQFVGAPCVGLLGADVLDCFDSIIDTAAGSLVVSTGELSHDGQPVSLDDFMGIPIVTARIGDRECRMFFDTGAQISYFQDESLTEFPFAGKLTDFYPGFGQFEVDTYDVPISIGGVCFQVRCGTLPGLLGMTLMMADAEGIVGNSILTGRRVGYFPRRRAIFF